MIARLERITGAATEPALSLSPPDRGQSCDGDIVPYLSIFLGAIP